jgi:hypothetical protein
VAALAFAFVFMPVESAQACGGFFCDSPGGGQPPMPVDQTGETIVFAFDGENVEAHIQIQYTGDPERFAWLIPLQTTPEITVGSAQLFLNLLNSTVPSVTVTPTSDACFQSSSDTSGPGCALGGSDSDEAAPMSASGKFTPPSADGNRPVTELRRSVGAFEVSILSGSSAAVEAWLVSNNFLPDDEAPRIVDEYASRGFVFAAIKLSAGAGLDELHPLVVKYRGTEPCVPLKLTAIAAEENMAVRAFFLGQKRAVPIGGYRHVSLNFMRLDWINSANRASNYVELVSNAVDAPGADGHAFVTEFAGSSAIVPRGLRARQWNSNSFSALRAVDVVDELERQTLMNCPSANVCEALHPQVFPLLRNHLPPPAGISEQQFWSCVSCYAQSLQLAPFDGVAFARDFEDRIVKPAEHGDALLARSPYVTRLFTTISPNEMTADPAFAELPENQLGDVSFTLAATDRATCDGKTVLSTADGREAAHGTTSPTFRSEMPWAERVEEFTADGTRIPIIDNGGAIDRELKIWNAQLGYDVGSADRQNLSETNGGCACQMRASSGHGLAFALLGLLGALRRATRRGLRGRVER